MGNISHSDVTLQTKILQSTVKESYEIDQINNYETLRSEDGKSVEFM